MMTYFQVNLQGFLKKKKPILPSSVLKVYECHIFIAFDILSWAYQKMFRA